MNTHVAYYLYNIFVYLIQCDCIHIHILALDYNNLPCSICCALLIRFRFFSTAPFCCTVHFALPPSSAEQTDDDIRSHLFITFFIIYDTLCGKIKEIYVRTFKTFHYIRVR